MIHFEAERKKGFWMENVTKSKGEEFKNDIILFDIDINSTFLIQASKFNLQ